LAARQYAWISARSLFDNTFAIIPSPWTGISNSDQSGLSCHRDIHPAVAAPPAVQTGLRKFRNVDLFDQWQVERQWTR